MTRATRILCLMHFIGDALLLWLAYYWLSVGESTIGRLLWSAFLAVVITAAALWLHGSGFAFFVTDRSALQPALVTALRRLAPLFVFATTLKSIRFCPFALIVRGMVEGFACGAPVCAMKLSVEGLALSRVTPPTVMVTITVVVLEVLPCGTIWNDVS